MHNKKKILLGVTHAGFGGVAKHVIDLAQYIKQTGNWTVDIACGVQKSEFLDAYRQVADNVIIIDGLVREISPINDYIAYRNVSRLLKSTSYDVVHAHGAKAGILFRLAAYNCKIPNIYTHHLVVYRQFKNFMNPIYRLVETIASNWCNYVIVVTKKNKQVLFSDGVVPDEKLKIIYNGIQDINPLYSKNKARAILGIQENTFFVVTVTRLDEPKDPLLLVESFANLYRKKHNCQLAIVGNGTLYREIQKKIFAKNIDEVVLMPGFINDVDVYLAAADVFCLSTKKEGLPIAILESMKYSLPIIAHEVDGIPEQVIDGWNGYLVTGGDIPAFTDKLERMYSDKLMRIYMGENSNKLLVERFMVDKNYSELVDLYDSLVNQKRVCKLDKGERI